MNASYSSTIQTKTVASTSLQVSTGALAPHHFGSIKVHSRTRNFGFQIQLNPTDRLSVVEFSLTSSDAPEAGQFSILLDLENGVLFDNINHTGVIARLHQNLQPLRQRRLPLLLRWSVEHHGGALIPRLEIGEEEWLYPAVRFAPNCQYLAMAGTSTGNQTLSHAYVWCQDQLIRGSKE